jgi:pimeloyl-ACP methyl ester carboxylesterase
MGLPAEEVTAEAEDFLKFCELVMAHHVIRTELLPVFSDHMLSMLKMPVLAIIGERDIVFRAKTMRRRIEACVPRAKLVCLARASHGLTDQTQTVLEFLSSEAASA